METTIEYDQDSSTTSCLLFHLRRIKNVQKTSTVIKVMIAIVSFTVVAIAGWQIHVNTVERNDTQSSQGSTSIAPASFPPQSWKYIEQFLHFSVSNDTLYHKCLPYRKKKLLQFEKDIRQFMNQKMVIEKLFYNVSCTQDDGDDVDDFAEWYKFILGSRPSIRSIEYYDIDDEDEGGNTRCMMQLKIDSFDFDDVCRTNNKGDILQIAVSNTHCHGSVNLTSLPQSLEVLNLDYNLQFSGTVDLTALPQSLKELKLQSNQFAGTVDLTSLPQSLTTLWLIHNQFTGSVDLKSLPDDLEMLVLENNKFTGDVDFTSLPQSLEILVLSKNGFTGSVNLTSLPQSLGLLMLNDNNFTGTVDMTSMPSLIEYLSLSRNPFKGTLDLRKIPDGLKHAHLQYSDDQFDSVIQA